MIRNRRNVLRVGIAGKRGLSLVSGFRALAGRAEIVAFCDPDPAAREQAEREGIARNVEHFTALLDDTVDAVVVATPMPLHVPQAVLALKAGKHVLCEVTAAVSLDECWLLRDTVLASGKTYMMAENYCYLRENVLVREMATKGLFGEPYFGEGEYLHEVRNYHHFSDGSPTWRYYWQVGVNGCTYGTHSLGPVMQWFTAADPTEKIETVSCFGTGRHTDPEHPQDDTTLMLCKLGSGKLIKIRVDMLSNRPHRPTSYELQGTRGVYESSRAPGDGGGRIWIGDSRDGEERKWRPVREFEEHLPSAWRNPPDEALRAGHGGGDYYEVRDFVEAIENGVTPPISLYDALEWTAAGLCSQLSIENGGAAVRVPNFRDPSRRPVLRDAPPIAP